MIRHKGKQGSQSKSEEGDARIKRKTTRGKDKNERKRNKGMGHGERRKEEGEKKRRKKKRKKTVFPAGPLRNASTGAIGVKSSSHVYTHVFRNDRVLFVFVSLRGNL